MATPATAPVCMAAPCPVCVQRGAVGLEAARSRPLGAARPSSRTWRGRPPGAAWPDLRRGSWPARGQRAAIVPQGATRFSAGPENGEHALVVAPEHPT